MSYLLTGLELQLLSLESKMNDPLSEDSRACIICFETESDCQCEENLYWKIEYAISLLKSNIKEMANA